jgi:ribosomal protein S18 acetylase RimI-like enzyme
MINNRRGKEVLFKGMQLVTPSAEHIVAMMDWFDNLAKLRVWAGPDFRFPFDQKSFFDDLKLRDLHSYVLLDKESSGAAKLIAFGQFYNRLNRCHLARLAVAPVFRGEGFAWALIDQLSARGRADLSVDSDSLFVLNENRVAIKAYTAMGFRPIAYPEVMPIKDCLYMVRE